MLSRVLHQSHQRSCNILNGFVNNHRCFASAVKKCDALVIGGGIAGSSVSYQLGKLHGMKVICLEKEDSPGYHATGKATGIFSENNARTYNEKLLSKYSRTFFESPDAECIDETVEDMNVLDQVGLVAISSPSDYPYLYSQFGPSEKVRFDQHIKVLPKKDVLNYFTFLNTNELATYAIYEPTAANFNTGLVYEHFLIGGNNVGVEYYFNQSAVEISKSSQSGNWEIITYNAETNAIDRFEASILVNACGQWADEIAVKASMKPMDIITQKRSVIVFTFKHNDDSNDLEFRSSNDDASENSDEFAQTPWIGWIAPDANEIFYSCFQANSGLFLYDKYVDISENKNHHDVHATDDEMELCLHKIHKYTNLKVKKIASKSAGIKCSVKNDENIVCGPAVEDNSFIHVCGLSGYGIQTSPAYSTIASCLAMNRDLPNEMIDLGIDVKRLLPSRFENLTK